MLSNWTLRLCLVAIKRFLENTYFPEMLISGKGKCFHGVWLHFKKFSEKYFLVFGKEERKHKSRKTQATTQKKIINDNKSSPTTAPSIAIRDRDQRLREIAISNLPLSPTYEISRSTLHEIALSIAISIRCDLAKARSRSTARSRDSEITINGDWNVCRRDRDWRGREIAIARALSLSLSLSFFGYTLKGK